MLPLVITNTYNGQILALNKAVERRSLYLTMVNHRRYAVIKKVKTIITLLAMTLALASCSKEPTVSTRDVDLFDGGQGANGGKAHLTVLKDTVARDQNGLACAIYKDEKIYFSDFQEEAGIWEFKLSQEIPGCELVGFVYINISDIEVYNHNSIVRDDTLDPTEQSPKTPDNEYESGDGFGDYDGPARKPEFFPLTQYPLDSYKNEGREFGAARSSGRKHAANDLLEYAGQSVHAVTSGEIIDYYYFYSGTYAIVVDHGQYVVRYGEVGGLAPGLKVGSKVTAGQKIGTVGRLYSGQSMLHFEKYTGSLKGNLTIRGNMPYQRRNDLVRPTEYLDRLSQTFPPR